LAVLRVKLRRKTCREKANQERIVYALKQAEAGVKTSEICREAGISEQTFYNWKRKYEVGLQRACGLMVLERSSFYYRSHPRDHRALSMRIKELAMTRIRFGYLRLTVLLKREGWPVGKKLVYRLYRELKLQVRTKRRKKLAANHAAPLR
jgi:transposase-like protein